MPSLSSSLPWTTTPLIINAPMADNAGGLLAATVSLSGGLGLIGTKNDMSITRRELNIARETLAAHSSLLPTNTSPTLLPIGIGFLPFILPLAAALPVVEEYK